MSRIDATPHGRVANTLHRLRQVRLNRRGATGPGSARPAVRRFTATSS